MSGVKLRHVVYEVWLVDSRPEYSAYENEYSRASYKADIRKRCALQPLMSFCGYSIVIHFNPPG